MEMFVWELKGNANAVLKSRRPPPLAIDNLTWLGGGAALHRGESWISRGQESTETKQQRHCNM